MLAAAPETLKVERHLVAFTMQASMNGIARRILETQVPARNSAAHCEQMIAMLCAYVKTVVR